VLGALACLAQMVSLPRATWERLIIWMILGFAVYFLYSRRRAHARRQLRQASLEAGTAASIGG
jgi:APA family basic amino acid/polyamine antiporter